MAQQSKGISKFVLALVQLSDCFHAGSLDVGDAPASRLDLGDDAS
jgi:hypothetical protein